MDALFANLSEKSKQSFAKAEKEWQQFLKEEEIFLKEKEENIVANDDSEEDDYYCCCMECGEIIPLEDGETPAEQEEWYNEEDELKLCADCEDK